LPFSLDVSGLGGVEDEGLELVDGGVGGGAVLELGGVDGGVAGAMLEELDEPVLGGVVVDDDDEPDGDGVTTGGVFGEVVVDDSRLQPATLRTSPAQNNVAIAVFIEISEKCFENVPMPDLAVSMP